MDRNETMNQVDHSGSVSANHEYYMVDLTHILRYLFKKLWIILLTGIVVAVGAFSYSAFMVTPMYASSVMLYVNNSSISVGNTQFNISSSDIIASQSLVKTYIVILQNRTTLQQVIEQAEVPYTYRQLSGMISAAPVNDTEVFRITVKSADPYEAAKIANTIAKVLPDRVSDIVDGASMRNVDMAVAELDKVSPSVTKNTAVGFMMGFLLACGVLTVICLLDDTIHDEDYILQNYDFPILAKIPDLYEEQGSKYAYYASSTRNGGQK